MAKWLKITIVSFAFLLAAISLAIFCWQVFGFHGQKISDLDPNQGEEQTIEDNTKDIANCTPQESLYILTGKLPQLSYHATVSGQVVPSLGNWAKQIVSGDKYQQNGKALYVFKSTSALIQVGKKLYIEQNNEANAFDLTSLDPETWSDQATHYNTIEDFLQDYGTDFRNISNYLLNDETILEAILVNSENGYYTYRYVLDTEKATVGYRINMAKMGNLSSAPSFNSCVLTIKMNKNFEPVYVTFDDVYMVEYFGFGVQCTSALTITYEKLNEPITFP